MGETGRKEAVSDFWGIIDDGKQEDISVRKVQVQPVSVMEVGRGGICQE